MFLKVQLPWNVIIAVENLQPESLMLQRSIITRLLSDFAMKKATKDLGYRLAVNTLERIGEGKFRLHTGDVLFHVVFNAITFKIFKGEMMEFPLEFQRWNLVYIVSSVELTVFQRRKLV